MFEVYLMDKWMFKTCLIIVFLIDRMYKGHASFLLPANNHMRQTRVSCARFSYMQRVHVTSPTGIQK